MAPAIAVCASLTSLNLAENNLGGETGYVNVNMVQGSSFNVGDKVIFQGREMIVSKGKDSDGEIKMKPVDWLLGINAIADALKVTASLTKILVRGNQLGGEGGKLLRGAVQGREGFELEL